MKPCRLAYRELSASSVPASCMIFAARSQGRSMVARRVASAVLRASWMASFIGPSGTAATGLPTKSAYSFTASPRISSRCSTAACILATAARASFPAPDCGCSTGGGRGGGMATTLLTFFAHWLCFSAATWMVLRRARYSSAVCSVVEWSLVNRQS